MNRGLSPRTGYEAERADGRRRPRLDRDRDREGRKRERGSPQIDQKRRKEIMAKTAEGDVDMFDEVDYEPDSDNEQGQQALPDPRPSAKEDRKSDPTAPVTNDCDKEKVMITGIPAGIGKKVRLTFSKALDLKTLTFTHLSLLDFS